LSKKQEMVGVSFPPVYVPEEGQVLMISLLGILYDDAAEVVQSGPRGGIHTNHFTQMHIYDGFHD
jgi:hypothetical protein